MKARPASLMVVVGLARMQNNSCRRSIHMFQRPFYPSRCADRRLYGSRHANGQADSARTPLENEGGIGAVGDRANREALDEARGLLDARPANRHLPHGFK